MSKRLTACRQLAACMASTAALSSGCLFHDTPADACGLEANKHMQGMSFWGYSEKLEIFTGARWDRSWMQTPETGARGGTAACEDLPCNCGLGDGCVKTKEHKAATLSRFFRSAHGSPLRSIAKISNTCGTAACSPDSDALRVSNFVGP